MSLFLRFILACMLTTKAMAALPPNTSVVAMLGLIPSCSSSCVTTELFQEAGCPLTNTGDLARCACSDITVQSHFSACVQQSCNFRDQIVLNVFASDLCDAYTQESRVDELKTIAIATIALSIPFLLLRLYSRWLKNSRLWADDAYAIFAGICLITVSVLILRMSLMGFGLHYWNVPVKNGVELLQLYYVCQMLYILVQIFAKVAILSLYSRLFPNFIRWFQWTVRGMIVFMFTHGLVFFLMVVLQCLPINSIWDKTITGKCLPVNVAIGFTGAGLSIAEDFVILLMPIYQLWMLQMSTRKRIGLVLLLSVGSFASITSIVRLKFMLKYANTYDSTWDNVDVLKWSLIEILAACICGNLMPLRPLIQKLMPNVHSVFNKYSRGSRKSSARSSEPINITWLGRLTRSCRKPKLISTIHFTSMDLTSSWENKTSRRAHTAFHSWNDQEDFKHYVAIYLWHADIEYNRAGEN
ncbi:integral membrane protein [Plenodomus tracheiphilus IPT5]|uniref:Integral membrane protein n=1 Tax=Plenodomus tracheiphilus IPT5 TaxID=1408161 RepID=A0A6A7BBU5_9PLEO|nr:integral membrane protein [Plenodomus tracheiphilus IPT5]